MELQRKQKESDSPDDQKILQTTKTVADVNEALEPNYSAFNIWQKRWIVFVSAFAAWFSTASSFLFFPAIESLAHGLNTSIQNINLTVTSYLIRIHLASCLYRYRLPRL